MTTEVIAQVEELVLQQGVPIIDKAGALFNINSGLPPAPYNARNDHEYQYTSDEDDVYNDEDYVTDVDPAELLEDPSVSSVIAPTPARYDGSQSSNASPNLLYSDLSYDSSPPPQVRDDEERNAHNKLTPTRASATLNLNPIFEGLETAPPQQDET